MNALRRNPLWRQKRGEASFTRQAPQQVFRADPPVFQLEQLLLQAAQRTYLVQTLRLPVIDDGGTSRRVEPAPRAICALLLPEPAQRLEKDRAGQVLGHSGITDLVGDKALEISGIRAVHLRQPV